LKWIIIDEQWNNTLHHHIHAPTLVLLDFMLRSSIDSSHIQRMVLNLQECAKISKEMEIYRIVVGTFDFDMAA